MLKHIAFIMDGNGRWAEVRGLSRIQGHRQGVEALQNIVEALLENQIPRATFYAFSSENWGRPKAEVEGLMALLKNYLTNEVEKLVEKGARIQFLGDRSEGSKLNSSILKLMTKAEKQTEHGNKIHINMCINYGGQDDIVRSVQKLVAAGAQAADITPAAIQANLDTTHQPLPDLCIRTGGEKRLSNFMLWQLSYAELFFTETYWPAFSKNELSQIIADFNTRQRRFGKLPKKT